MHKSVLLIVVILCVIAVFFGVRLGYKTANLSETDIIDHYAKAFLASMESRAMPVDSGHCYAIAGQSVWERLRVICDVPDGSQWVYRVGYWGQLLDGSPILGPGDGT